jgi:hypothetical protein
MDLSDPNAWTDGIKIVRDAPHVVVPLIMAALATAWWFRGTVERSKRDGLQAIINGRDAQLAGKDAQLLGLTTQAGVTQERLQLANEAQKDLTSKFAAAQADVEKLKKQLAEKAPAEAVLATANSTAGLMNSAFSANTALHRLLQEYPIDVETIERVRKRGVEKFSSTTRSND